MTEKRRTRYLMNFGYRTLAQRLSCPAISGPPEISVPSSGLFAADKLTKENPQILRRTIRAVLEGNGILTANGDQTVQLGRRATRQKWQWQKPRSNSYSSTLLPLVLIETTTVYSDNFFTRLTTSFGWFITSRICASTSAPGSAWRSRRRFFASWATSGSPNVLR